MTLAASYNPVTSFANDETNTVAGRSTVRTVALDTELANAASSINGLKSNLEKIQRDDDKLKDFIVEPYALSEQTRALFSARGTPRGLWAAATVYAVGDLVQQSSVAYICYTAHTASNPFTVNGFWIGISGDGSAGASAAAAAASQTAAAASATNAGNSATNAATSATTATTGATNAGNSATAAGNSATAAGNSAGQAAASAASVAASNFPAPLTSKALNLLRVNAAETGYEHRTATQVRSDISAAASGANSDITSLAILPGYLFGCTLSTAGSSTTMSISAGRATDSTGVQSMALTAIAKTTSAWAVGTAAGGLDTGAIANNTWYHFFAIRRPDTGVVDVLFSLSATAPTLPANYTQFRRIGSGRTNGSAQWTSFVQFGDDFFWAAPTLDVNTTAPTASRTLYTLTVPTGVKVLARLSVSHTSVQASSQYTLVTSPDVADVAPGLGAFTVIGSDQAAVSTHGNTAEVYTNTSAQVGVRVSTSTAVVVVTSGWTDSRGRNA